MLYRFVISSVYSWMMYGHSAKPSEHVPKSLPKHLPKTSCKTKPSEHPRDDIITNGAAT